MAHLAPRPRLYAADHPELDRAYAAAVSNLLDINTVPGRRAGDPERFIRAGAGYPEPWTRDAAFNSWGAASILEPDVARATLLMVCQERAGSGLVIAQDDQWWDQVIWIVAAWQHFLATGDDAFLAQAHRIGTASLEVLHRTRYRAEFGLYAGPALIQDSISAYPSPPADPVELSSFVLDYPATHEIMCLSTNAVYVGALRCLGRMAAQLDGDPAPWDARADALRDCINERLWSEQDGRYGFFVHGSGGLAGVVDRHQEAAGLATAVIFGIADRSQADLVLSRTHRQPRGRVNVWPHFDRYSDDRPGRGNVTGWPLVMGLFGLAGVTGRRIDIVAEAVADITALIAGSDWHFQEVYNCLTGDVDGGWQSGRHWDSRHDQTWSATALLRLVHLGLFGFEYELGGLAISDGDVASFGHLQLRRFPYRAALLDVNVEGSGDILSITLDGQDVTHRRIAVPATLTGRHDLVVRRRARALPG